jgi:tRNA threonylcarbamoyladenosine biosynthesis protein TsaE
MLAAVLAPGDLVLFEGPLGAGKTFLVRSIARGLNVPGSVPVTSPTFELVHEFQGRIPILHVDLYRLDPGTSLRELGLSDRVGRDALALVEWGERFAAQLGPAALTVRLGWDGHGVRRCTLEAAGERGDRVVALLAARAAHATGAHSG